MRHLFLILILLSVVLAGCKTVKTTENTFEQDSLRITQRLEQRILLAEQRSDSLLERLQQKDSTYSHHTDSIVIWQKGDTVYRDRYIGDYVYTAHWESSSRDAANTGSSVLIAECDSTTSINKSHEESKTKEVIKEDTDPPSNIKLVVWAIIGFTILGFLAGFFVARKISIF